MQSRSIMSWASLSSPCQYGRLSVVPSLRKAYCPSQSMCIFTCPDTRQTAWITVTSAGRHANFSHRQHSWLETMPHIYDTSNKTSCIHMMVFRGLDSMHDTAPRMLGLRQGRVPMERPLGSAKTRHTKTWTISDNWG